MKQYTTCSATLTNSALVSAPASKACAAKERGSSGHNISPCLQLVNCLMSHPRKRGYSSVPQKKSITMLPLLPLSLEEGHVRPFTSSTRHSANAASGSTHSRGR